MSEVKSRSSNLKPAGYGGGTIPLPEDMQALAQWVWERDQKAADSKAADERLDAAAERAVKRLLDLCHRLISGGDPIGSQLAAAGWYNLREHKAVRTWWAGLEFSLRLSLIRDGWAADRGGSIADAVPPAVWKKFNANIRISGLSEAIMGDVAQEF